jgi:hypothetical protein
MWWEGHPQQNIRSCQVIPFLVLIGFEIDFRSFPGRVSQRQSVQIRLGISDHLVGFHFPPVPTINIQGHIDRLVIDGIGLWVGNGYDDEKLL